MTKDNATPEETVTITKEFYEELWGAWNMLNCLEDVGVDSWQGYDLAFERMNEQAQEGALINKEVEVND